MKYLPCHSKSDPPSQPHVFLVKGDQAFDLTACEASTGNVLVGLKGRESLDARVQQIPGGAPIQ